MRGLLFLSRLAFICNCLFLVCLIMQRTQDIIPSQDLKGLIIIMGWFIGPFLNLALHIWLLGLLVYQRANLLPRWLVLANLLFLIAQFLIYFIFPS